MDIIGFTGEEKQSVWTVLAAILHLGNVTFVPDPKVKGNAGVEYITGMSFLLSSHSSFGSCRKSLAS